MKITSISCLTWNLKLYFCIRFFLKKYFIFQTPTCVLTCCCCWLVLLLSSETTRSCLPKISASLLSSSRIEPWIEFWTSKMVRNWRSNSFSYWTTKRYKQSDKELNNCKVIWKEKITFLVSSIKSSAFSGWSFLNLFKKIFSFFIER